MNHLAHALIAERTGTSMAGNLMGDYVKGRLDDGRWEESILEGIRLHRRVDAWTDDHVLFRCSRDRIRPELRRWSGILVDLYWDHALARCWDDLSAEPLPVFTARVYDELGNARSILPERMHRFVDYMISTDLLAAYAEVEGIRGALLGMSMRIRRENPLADAASDLPEIYPGIETDFLQFQAELFDWLTA